MPQCRQTVSAKEAIAAETNLILNSSYNAVASSYRNVMPDSLSTADVQVQKRIDEAVLDEYLKDAGFSAEFIIANDYSTKLELYNDKATFSSDDTTYGVMTDDCHISYKLNDDGSVSIELEELAKLNKLLADDAAVRKVLNDKAISKNEAELAKICETKVGMAALRALPSEVAIRALTNWTATMTCVHIYYKPVHGSPEATKTLIYNWELNYEPTWALTDKVALVWGSGFVADESAYSLYEVYKVAPNNTEQRVWNKTTYDYAEYDVNVGAAMDIDIKDYKTSPNLYAGGWRYRLKEHTR